MGQFFVLDSVVTAVLYTQVVGHILGEIITKHHLNFPIYSTQRDNNIPLLVTSV